MTRRIVLWVPELQQSLVPASSPLLDRLAGRGQRMKLVAAGPNLVVQQFEALGVPCPADSDCPAAALTALRDGLDPGTQAYWLRFDPVHLLAHKSQLLLMDPQVLCLTPDEARAFADTLNSHFAELGWQVVAARPDRWYLRLPQPIHIQTTPLAAVIGQDVDRQMPKGADALSWHVYLNEVQMLLHDHPCNQTREEAGLPVVNSVWPWGGGQLPHPLQGWWQSVAGDDPLLQSLGQLSGARAAAFPADVAAWVRALASGPHLLFYPEILETQEKLANFEETVLGPLIEALKSADIACLVLVAGMDEARSGMLTVLLERKQLHRWWRRARPFLSGQAIGEATDWRRLATAG
ncbi:hypothetical protein [Thermithiobacillus plumbiphilus]|uniref:Phosphoglycerate mutase n=1 Tax=Thermithiobacillus plumbiphilus TaxID=1729899 RepID=A0ABU9DBH9_9PROT